MKTVDLERLREHMAYDPVAGVVTWLKPRVAARIGARIGKRNAAGYRLVSWYPHGWLAEHRIAWALHHGTWPDKQVDHINGVRDDNRIANLRLATRREQVYNSVKKSINTSGHKGVSFDKSHDLWVAQIRTGGKSSKFLGYFYTIDEAVAAYKGAAVIVHGEFAEHLSRGRR